MFQVWGDMAFCEKPLKPIHFPDLDHLHKADHPNNNHQSHTKFKLLRADEISHSSAQLNEPRPQPYTKFKYQNFIKSPGLVGIKNRKKK